MVQNEEKMVFLMTLDYTSDKYQRHKNTPQAMISLNPLAERPKFAKNPLFPLGGPYIGLSFKKPVRNFWNYNLKKN